MEKFQLELFIETTQYGSFQKVAEQNRMSQRAVSKRIGSLEAELNAPLFVRGHNRIQLTPAGYRFRQRAESILNAMDVASYEAQQLAQQTPQTLSIGYFSPFDGVLLRRALVQTTPDHHYFVEERGIEHLVADVALARLDCALVMDGPELVTLTQPTNLKSVPIFRGHTVIGLADQTVGPQQTTVALDQLRQSPIIYYSNEQSTYLGNTFKAGLRAIGPHLDLHRVTSYEHMQLLVGLGQAMSFYPQELLPAVALANDGIRYLPLADPVTSAVTFSLIYRSDATNPAIKSLIAKLQQLTD